MASNKRDFVVPELPPVPDIVNPHDHSGNWLWRHMDITTDSYRNRDELEPPPVPNTEPITAENPLEVHVCDSVRSPYSYLVVPRLAYLQSQYNCKVELHVVFPLAIRDPSFFGQPENPTSGEGFAEHPKKGGRWYKIDDIFWDCIRVGQYQGMPFRFAHPDPIKQVLYPHDDPNYMRIAPIEDQPYISWMVRLANAAELAGKSVEFLLYTGPLIWGGKSEYWPADIPEAIGKCGMDYDATIKDIQENPAKYDAVWQASQKLQMDSGHGGVPNMVFNGEPFFGQDRFDHLFWRLQRNGLTKRVEPIEPFVTKPLRWPAGD